MAVMLSYNRVGMLGASRPVASCLELDAYFWGDCVIGRSVVGAHWGQAAAIL